MHINGYIFCNSLGIRITVNCKRKIVLVLNYYVTYNRFVTEKLYPLIYFTMKTVSINNKLCIQERPIRLPIIKLYINSFQ